MKDKMAEVSIHSNERSKLETSAILFFMVAVRPLSTLNVCFADIQWKDYYLKSIIHMNHNTVVNPKMQEVTGLTFTRRGTVLGEIGCGNPMSKPQAHAVCPSDLMRRLDRRHYCFLPAKHEACDAMLLGPILQ